MGEVGKNEAVASEVSRPFDCLPAAFQAMVIPPEQIELFCQDDKPISLGEGGYGKVFLVLFCGSKAAMKVVSGGAAEQYTQCLNEVRILSQSKHSRLVQFFGICPFDEKLAILMEHMDDRSLYERIGMKDPEMQWHRR